MGLDMYLRRKSYVKNWDHMRPEELHKITVKRGGRARADIKPERISYIIEDVAYWRKANAIHRWFVTNCQDGTDDCREAFVTHEHLAQLVMACRQVLDVTESVAGDVVEGVVYSGGQAKKITKRGRVAANPKIADGVLPTQAGFFFGSTDYDEYYLDDLRRTVEMIEPLLSDEEGEFYYHSSW